MYNNDGISGSQMEVEWNRIILDSRTGTFGEANCVHAHRGMAIHTMNGTPYIMGGEEKSDSELLPVGIQHNSVIHADIDIDMAGS